MKFTNLKTELSNEKILKKLNCTMASPLHDEFFEELLEIKKGFIQARQQAHSPAREADKGKEIL